VIDFDFDLNLTPFIASTWNCVAVIQPKKRANTETISLRAALEEYTVSDSKIKKIVCKKELIGWDFKEMRNKIKATIYNAGYQRNINVVR
jgi:hypothetical protein